MQFFNDMIDLLKSCAQLMTKLTADKDEGKRHHRLIALLQQFGMTRITLLKRRFEIIQFELAYI